MCVRGKVVQVNLRDHFRGLHYIWEVQYLRSYDLVMYVVRLTLIFSFSLLKQNIYGVIFH